MTNSPDSANQLPDPSDVTTTQQLPELDRDLLNDLTMQAAEPQAYYGRDLTLTESHRTQLLLVAAKADARLAPMYEDPKWKAFEALMREGSDKGVLLSFVTNPGTNIPIWCVDGGGDAEVRKIRTDTGGAGIEVPSDVYNTFHWKLTVENLRQDATASDEALKGRTAKPLGQNLRQLAHLLKKPE